MEISQTASIIQLVVTYYRNYTIEDVNFEVMSWHQVLKDYDFETVQNNFMQYLKSGERFPPTVGQLVCERDPEVKRVTPDTEETRAMFLTWEERKQDVATPEERQAALDKIREMLKGNRGNDL